MILLADNQDITRAGLRFLIEGKSSVTTLQCSDKAGLIDILLHHDISLVILDYTLFDISDADELLVIAQRFFPTRWMLFSDELSVDFIRQVVTSSALVSVVMKDASIHEIRQCIEANLHDTRFLCQRTTELLLMPQEKPVEKVNLTKTEMEILKEIALGLTTREIAEQRFSSFHTVNTHRKNIFRKLGVNNVREATKYALRAGLVDAAEYYI